jgi:hypothetical protein
MIATEKIIDPGIYTPKDAMTKLYSMALMSPEMIFKILPMFACLIENALRLVIFSNIKFIKLILAVIEKIKA